MRLHQNIAGLMVFVFVLAVGLTALSQPSGFLASAVYSLTFGLLTASLWGVATKRGGQRAAWLGFAVTGWCYFALCFGTLDDPRFEKLSRALITSRLCDQIFEQFHANSGADSPPFTVWDQFARQYVERSRRTSWSVWREDFWRTAQSLTTLAIASIGAILASRRPRTVVDANPDPAHDSA